jgi:hypothetical protein
MPIYLPEVSRVLGLSTNSCRTRAPNLLKVTKKVVTSSRVGVCVLPHHYS